MIVGTASVTLAHRENLTDKVQGCESQTARTMASEVWWFTLELIDGSTPTIRTKFRSTRRRVSWGECRAALGGNGIEVD